MTQTSRSDQLWESARKVVPLGTHSDSRSAQPHTLYIQSARGATLTDVDGKQWLDCKMGNGAIMLGHGAPEVNAAAVAAMERGLAAGYESDLSIEAAQRMHELLTGAERIRFANSGTEAAMHAIMLARAITGRERIAKPEGGYDGWYDPVWVSTWGAPDAIGPADAPWTPPGSAGISAHASGTVVLPFNNLPATEKLLRQHASELAAVIMEPVLIDIGFIPADPAYLEGVRAVTRELGIVLIFDELLTGFRLPGNCAAAHYGVIPDLSIYGKAIGNGHVVAAMTGLAQVMEAQPAPQFVGTFNGHGVSMAAVNAMMQKLADGSVREYIQALSDRLGAGIHALGQRYSIPVQYQGGGGHFNIYFNEKPVTDYRSAFASNGPRYVALSRQLQSDGILICGKYLLHNALSYAHTEADVDRFLERAERAFAKM